jgi:hypothetical protein
MTSGKEPKTVRELYFYIDGKFDTMKETIEGELSTINESIKNTRKITFWIGGITGAIVSGVMIGVFKFLSETIGK